MAGQRWHSSKPSWHGLQLSRLGSEQVRVGLGATTCRCTAASCFASSHQWDDGIGVVPRRPVATETGKRGRPLRSAGRRQRLRREGGSILSRAHLEAAASSSASIFAAKANPTPLLQPASFPLQASRLSVAKHNARAPLRSARSAGNQGGCGGAAKRAAGHPERAAGPLLLPPPPPPPTLTRRLI